MVTNPIKLIFPSKNKNKLDIYLATTQEKAIQLSKKFQNQKAIRLVFIPTIKVTPIQDWHNTSSGLKQLVKIKLLLFTSQNAVIFFFKKMKELNLIEKLAKKQFITIGEQTAKKIEKWIPTPQIFIPKIKTTAGLLNLLKQKKLQKSYCWFLCSNLSDKIISNYIRQNGGNCLQEVIYKNDFPVENKKKLQNYFTNNTPYWAIFSSPSSFSNLIENLPNPANFLQKTRIMAIGKTTANSIKKKKYSVFLATDQNLIQSINSLCND